MIHEQHRVFGGVVLKKNIYCQHPLAAWFHTFDGINDPIPDLGIVCALSSVRMYVIFLYIFSVSLPTKFLLLSHFSCLTGNILDSMLQSAPNKEAAESGKETSGSTAPASSSQRQLRCHCYPNCPEDSTNNTCGYGKECRGKKQQQQMYCICMCVTNHSLAHSHKHWHSDIYWHNITLLPAIVTVLKSEIIMAI